MQIRFLNNEGSGYAKTVNCPEGITLQQLLAQEMGAYGAAFDARDHLIRVNREPAAADQVLKEGDRITVTPRKVEGAY